MKLLLDSSVWAGARTQLEAAGHDVVAVADWGEDPGDEEILERAYAAGRVLVTIDKDFGELVIVRGKAHAGLIRLVDFSARQQGPICVTILAQYGDVLATGAIVTASQNRVRVRPPETDQP
ncbi:MAG: DUF5615 family PIN-like protein [Anaerolineae bacterium]|nr:DUF5615 family PIN-like protein [Anaerolineae bacterium]